MQDYLGGLNNHYSFYICLYFRICGYMDDIMDIFETGDTILLGEGNHSIKGSNGLQEGGTIIGLSNTENTIISPLDPDMSSSLFDFCGNEVVCLGSKSDVSTIFLLSILQFIL